MGRARPGVMGSRARDPFAVAAALAVLVASSCATAAGVLSERELAAARAWKPTRWADGKGTALVVMDMQRANMPVFSQSEVVGNILKLVSAADAAGSPVVWVYSEDEDARPGEEGFELAPEFEPGPGHFRVVKTGTSAFTGTGLGELLEEKGVGRIVFCGVSSNECVKATVAASYYDGWLTVVAKDAHSVPVRSGTDEGARSMNARWSADRRVELRPSAAIRFGSSR